MADLMMQFGQSLYGLLLEAAPWLVFGLLVSGLLQAFLPSRLLGRWMGGRGVRPILTAAVVGTPLPLCSCSVIPAALTLRRQGASRGATVSFLIATPENGADSIALSYALLGPFMTVVRPIAGIVSAIGAGLLTWAWAQPEATLAAAKKPAPLAAMSNGTASCCGKSDACCGAAGNDLAAAPEAGLRQRLRSGMHYAFFDLLDDIAAWLVVGLLLAAAVATFVPPDAMAAWGSGLAGKLAMIAIGVPMYICATASTPLAAALLLAGVSPGTVLVFLLAGPATNLATVGLLRRELGTRCVAAYLVGIAGGALAFGVATDALVSAWSVDVAASAGSHDEMIPFWLAWVCLAVLVLLLMRSLVRRLWSCRRHTGSEEKTSLSASPAPGRA